MKTKKWKQLSLIVCPIAIIVLMTLFEFMVDHRLICCKEESLSPTGIIVVGVTLAVFIVCNVVLNRSNLTLKGWSSILYRYLQGSGTDKWVNLSFLIYTLFHLSWIADSIFDVAKEPESYGWWHPAIFILGYIIVLLMKPIYNRVDVVDDTKRTTLVTGLSEVKYLMSNNAQQQIFCNLDVLLNILKKYPNISTLRILLSEQMMKNYDQIGQGVSPASVNYEAFMMYKEQISCKAGSRLHKSDVEWFAPVLSDLINICAGSRTQPLRVICSLPVDYNSFKECYDELSQLIKKEAVSDSDLLINITAGTSNVSGAATIQAVIGDRCLIYIDQNTNQPEVYNPQVCVLPELFDELNN